MSTRRATEADLETLARIHRQAFSPGWSGEEIAELGSGAGVFALLIEDPVARAMILCRTVAEETEILTLAVAPDARRQGLARTLIEAALRVARKDGAQSVVLEVAVDNDPARTLYETSQFVQVGRRRGYYRRADGSEADAVIMRHDLNSGAISPYH